ncbi:MAG: ATP-binding cassette domain-containing protein, partial [Betaproteobacteria bacterium]|nr:ATP-binding cassette domain-containing protein [Betaproteobacteria bacterium]
MQFARGQVVALMGGSGSGKTTILRLLGGQLTPTAGRVLFEGRDVSQLKRQ